MTRKHFEALAWGARQQALRIIDETSLDENAPAYYRQRQWDLDTLALADVCAAFNGAFDRGRFLIAAGYTHRPDGSMWPWGGRAAMGR